MESVAGLSIRGKRSSVHWVPLTKSSVTTSTRLQRADFFASKSLTAILKSSVTTCTHLYRAVSFASFYSLEAGSSVISEYLGGYRYGWMNVLYIDACKVECDKSDYESTTMIHKYIFKWHHYIYLRRKILISITYSTFLFLFFFLRVQQFCQSFLFGKKKATILIWYDQETLVEWRLLN